MFSTVKTIQWGGEFIKEIRLYGSLPSTNDFGRELVLSDGRSGILIWALRQQAGKGRRGRKWYADNSSLTFSLIWALPADFPYAILPLTTGLGLVLSLQQIAGDIKVKWPNDLWVGSRKLGGILGETIFYNGQRWLILGVGLNVNKPDIAIDQGICLEEITGSYLCRFAVLDLALQGVEQGLKLARAGIDQLSSLFQQHGNFLARPITIFQGEDKWVAVAKAVLPDGRLLVEDARGVQALMPDEISVRFCS